jgi:hypothetical protein
MISRNLSAIIVLAVLIVVPILISASHYHAPEPPRLPGVPSNELPIQKLIIANGYRCPAIVHMVPIYGRLQVICDREDEPGVVDDDLHYAIDWDRMQVIACGPHYC